MSRFAGRHPTLGRDRDPRPVVDRDPAAVGPALRLAIGKDGLGIELARSAPLGVLDVVELVVRLPRVRFPFDVSGGVTKFRHKRGELERLAVELDARRVAQWAAPLLRGLISARGDAKVAIAPRAFGATVTVTATRGRAPKAAALAFEVAFTAGADLALVAHSARGVNLPAPATALAIRALAALLAFAGDSARREGARFVFPRAAQRLARALLPESGMRAPSGSDVVLTGSGESDGVLFIAFARGPAAAVAIPPPGSTLADEAAHLTRAADDARVAGDYARARQLDLASLERAPRHAAIAQRIAEVDAFVGGRAEAAAATLRAADRAGCLGELLGELLVETSDARGALAALLREGERDPSAAVAALAYARAASLAAVPADALEWLDRAVSRSPTLAELRWERASRRLAQGRLVDARADFQELEAAAEGARERYDVVCRAAGIHRELGLATDAAALYERALLYRPDDPESLAGLGAAIAAASEGGSREARGATLLARAIELANARIPPPDVSWMQLELARVLGDRLGDRPAAVARLRAIPDEAAEAIAARGLEGRYRSELGDVAGASLAFARLRERAGHERTALPWLAEAAEFEAARGELVRAQSHLSAALTIAPTDPGIQAKFRVVSERLAPVNVHVPVHVSDLEEPAAEPLPEEDEARVEALTRMLQGDPTNDAVVDELTVRLTRLGRSMELLALLSARLEDAPPHRRAELLPRHRAVLEKLEAEARAAGREGEADLFKMARDAAT